MTLGQEDAKKTAGTGFRLDPSVSCTNPPTVRPAECAPGVALLSSIIPHGDAFSMRRSLPRVSAFLIATLVANISTQGQELPSAPMIGFSQPNRNAQTKSESFALTIPTAEKSKTWLRTLTEEPHVAGTPADYKTAIDVRDKLRSWGWRAELSEYDVLLNYPVANSVKLEIVRPTPVTLKVTEDPHAADKDSASADAFPAFHGYGVSGDVTGQIVYGNYGRLEDLAALEAMGIDIKDKIILVRYGEIFRGLKVRNAQKRGAKGILIFSDPGDDGYAKGDVYPNGPYRPGSAIQRGSVQFLSLGPGDPSTPGFASLKGSKRLPIDVLHGFPLGEPPASSSLMGVKEWERKTGLNREDHFATIPSLPISYDAALPMLRALGGPNAPSGWQGGLPLPYHVGPGPCEVRFAVQMDYKVRTIWNVIGTIPGSVEPDRWVMIGNHRDAWVYGAVDPNSGTAATLETCRALGAAVKSGWKPRRSLVYASWDAEEYGLVGSTEWADEHAREIDQKAVLLLNVDSAVSGPELDLDGIPSLRDFVLEAAGGITDPRKGGTLRDNWLAKHKGAWASGAVELDDRIWNVGNKTTFEVIPPRPFVPQFNTLGSGSDYTAFVDHLGVPSLDIGFNGKYGVYHSIYDNFFWMEKFGDPEFITHATAARLYTIIAMRAAGAEVVPFRFAPYGEALRDYVDDLRRMIARKARTIEPNARHPFAVYEDLPSVVTAVRVFQTQANLVDKATAVYTDSTTRSDEKLGKLNDLLVRVERAFLMPAGLPGRPWFKHAIYAPGLTTGYACWPLPGVRQAVIESDVKMMEPQVIALVARIEAATDAMKAVLKFIEDDTKTDKEPAEPTTKPANPQDKPDR
jgi:N-acetylated-alpha-linked acidic dipeptidase